MLLSLMNGNVSYTRIIIIFKIEYNYHDSIIQRINISESQVQLDIQLYPLQYPTLPIIKLEIIDIYNFEKVSSYFQNILIESEKDEDEGYGIGCRIDSIHFNQNKVSIDQHLHMIISTDWCGPIKIHSQLVRETLLKETN